MNVESINALLVKAIGQIQETELKAVYKGMTWRDIPANIVNKIERSIPSVMDANNQMTKGVSSGLTGAKLGSAIRDEISTTALWAYAQLMEKEISPKQLFTKYKKSQVWKTYRAKPIPYQAFEDEILYALDDAGVADVGAKKIKVL